MYCGSVPRKEGYVEFLEGEKVDTQSGVAEVDRVAPYIAARGPNYSSLRIGGDEKTCWFSSVLSLRQPFAKQSVLVANGRYVLQFNGELYNSEIGAHSSDTQFVVDKLEACNGDVVSVLRSLSGEFAYTVTDTVRKQVYFGRDAVGKRSLSYCVTPDTNELYVASVTGTTSLDYVNCMAGTVYMFDMESCVLDESTSLLDPRDYEVTPQEDPELVSLPQTIDALYGALTESVRKRITTIHPKHIENSPIAVLFSGGLDCSVIVALICQQLTCIAPNTAIELLNVGFENPRTKMQPSDTPDRKLAQQSYATLHNLFPEISMSLVEVDVPYDQYLEHRPKVIDLMYPKNTEMDLSIAIAFYFAARGVGYITSPENPTERKPYNRKGIVLFSGLGADELYGGYHKLANKSTPELVAELTRQISNIHDRNLNRDDKVIAANGVEVRYPFLDEDVIRMSTTTIPITYKINKLVLRRMAGEKLGLGPIADEPKRAIQFGSKSAKMTKDGNKNGTDVLK